MRKGYFSHDNADLTNVCVCVFFVSEESRFVLVFAAVGHVTRRAAGHTSRRTTEASGVRGAVFEELLHQKKTLLVQLRVDSLFLSTLTSHSSKATKGEAGGRCRARLPLNTSPIPELMCNS